MYSENINEIRNYHSYGDSSEGVGSKKLDFRFYWSALRRSKWPIIFFTALMTAIAVAYTLRAVPIYSASATLLLESQKANIVSIEDLVTSEQESLDYYNTQYAVLKSRAMAERVLRHLMQSDTVTQAKLAAVLSSSSPKFLELLGFGQSSAKSVNAPKADEGSTDATGSKDRGEREYNALIKRFRESLSISPIVRTKLVTISYESSDPEFSALAANAVAEQYIQRDLEQRDSRKEEASAWMDGRIQELKVKLDDSENALLAFKRANGLVDLNGNVGLLNDQQLIFTSSELAKARVDLSNSRDLYLKTQNYKSTSPDLLETLLYVKNDIAVRTVSAELERAQRDLSELRNRYGNKHPRIVNAQSNLASLRSTQRKNIDRAVAIFENDYQLLKQRVESLEANIVQGKESIQLIGQQKVTLESLEREAAANREQYNKLFDRITEIRTTDGLDEANAVVSENAWVPTSPVKPNKVVIVAIAMFASLLLAAAVSFIREFLDDTVSRKADIEKRLKSRLLGVIPLVGGGMFQRNNEDPLTPSDVADKSDTFMEAVNTCRTALSLSGGKDAKVILVTSSVPNEGKSTVALNLAYSYGQLERTLLLDCDLRRPSIASALGLPTDSTGLSNLLLGKSVEEGSIKCGVLDSFDCLTSGPVPENPLELLASEKFAVGLKALRKHYDKIIIDSAPTHVVSDAIVLSQLADQVLYVVKPHETPIKLVDTSLARLAEARASIAGICLSQVDINKSKYYGDLEFHGFGHNYQGYGKYYTQIDRHDDREPTQRFAGLPPVRQQAAS